MSTLAKNVVAVVLGGGRGTRLYPLTSYRSKPAVPLAGKYRLIDIPLSNCINSGLNRIYVLTQFNPSACTATSAHLPLRSLRRRLRRNPGRPADARARTTDWYQGTADAVRKNLRYCSQPGVDYVLILSGDQLYRMDFRDMIATHMESRRPT